MYFPVLLSALLVCIAGVPLNSTKPKLEGRILGGTDTDITSHPYMVRMWYRGGPYSCVGSIVSEKWVVTIAECYIKKYPKEYIVRAGSTDANNGGTLHLLTRAITSSCYSLAQMDCNIAVAEVDPPFTFSDKVQPIQLNCDPLPAGTEVVVAGWGSTQAGGSYLNNSLNHGSLLISIDGECKDTYPGFYTERFICAGDHQQDTGPCYGDTSAPLLYNNKLAGMHVMGDACSQPGSPGMYTKVSAFCDWIAINTEL